MERDQGLISATNEAPATLGSMPLSDNSESLCRKEDNKTFDSAKSPDVDEIPALDNLSATDGFGSQLGAILGSSMVSGSGDLASVDQLDTGTVPASSPQANPEDTAEQVPNDAGAAIDKDIDVEKLEEPLQEQDTNGKEDKDNADEVLASNSKLADNLPSLSTLDPALNCLASSSHSAGQSGESNDNNEPHDEVVCDDTSFVSVVEVSGNDKDHGTSEGSPSLVRDSNSVEMEIDQGLNSATDEAATTFGSRPLDDGSGKFESPCREEDEKNIISAESSYMDKCPASSNLSEGVTDVVGPQLGAISVAAAIVDHPEEAAATFESRPLADESGKFESLCSEEDEKIIVSAESSYKDNIPASSNLSEGVTDVVGPQLGAVSVAAAIVDHPEVTATSPQYTTQDTIYPSVEQVPKDTSDAPATDTDISVDKLDIPQEQDPNEEEGNDHMDAPVEVSISITEVACPTAEEAIVPDNLSDGAVNTNSEVHGDTFDNESGRSPDNEDAEESAAPEVSISVPELACPTPEEAPFNNLSDGAANTISGVLENALENDSAELPVDEQATEDASVSTSTMEVAYPGLIDSLAPSDLSDAPVEMSNSATVEDSVESDNLSDGAGNTISEDTSGNESMELPTPEQAKQDCPNEVSISTTEIPNPTTVDFSAPTKFSDGTLDHTSEVVGDTSANEPVQLPADQDSKENVTLASDNLSEGAVNIISEALGETPSNESAELLIDEHAAAPFDVVGDTSANEPVQSPADQDSKENARSNESADNLSEGAANTVSEALDEAPGYESAELLINEHAAAPLAVVGDNVVQLPADQDSKENVTLASDNLSEGAANTISEALGDTPGNESPELLIDEHAAAPLEVPITTEIGLSQSGSHMNEEEIPGELECGDDIMDTDVDSKPEPKEAPTVLESVENKDVDSKPESDEAPSVVETIEAMDVDSKPDSKEAPTLLENIEEHDVNSKPKSDEAPSVVETIEVMDVDSKPESDEASTVSESIEDKDACSKPESDEGPTLLENIEEKDVDSKLKSDEAPSVMETIEVMDDDSKPESNEAPIVSESIEDKDVDLKPESNEAPIVSESIEDKDVDSKPESNEAPSAVDTIEAMDVDSKPESNEAPVVLEDSSNLNE
ncbi:hypothetical protein MIMGU_mgv1a000474mg [Erythranthe guttata]|uniref:Uncharacterized protein n=2 Tax=Erythranthe guttata TaxID=4155 RepID=A0A022S2Y5_ERYGU|nr:hypothetical protein MIMGU_mgv1a000474mg [Erythranthe guttata]